MNKIVISGLLKEKPKFLHECKGENFYGADIVSERLSGTVDELPCVIPEIYANSLQESERVKFIGEIRTRNVDNGGKRKLDMFVFVTGLAEYGYKDENSVEIDGFICKEADYRETPLGRQIADVLVASNRPYGKSDYIPCICWGRNAIKIASLQIGDRIGLHGRFQSREYTKMTENGVEVRTAYEVSASCVELGGFEDESGN